jgi:hypothetical protein
VAFRTSRPSADLKARSTTAALELGLNIAMPVSAPLEETKRGKTNDETACAHTLGRTIKVDSSIATEIFNLPLHIVTLAK